jgi:hypothetical protein
VVEGGARARTPHYHATVCFPIHTWRSSSLHGEVRVTGGGAPPPPEGASNPQPVLHGGTPQTSFFLSPPWTVMPQLAQVEATVAPTAIENLLCFFSRGERACLPDSWGSSIVAYYSKRILGHWRLRISASILALYSKVSLLGETRLVGGPHAFTRVHTRLIGCKSVNARFTSRDASGRRPTRVHARLLLGSKSVYARLLGETRLIGRPRTALVLDCRCCRIGRLIDTTPHDDDIWSPKHVSAIPSVQGGKMFIWGTLCL